jgi:hypothetical protein
MKRRHLLSGFAVGSLAPLASEAEEKEPRPTPAPPTYPIHSLSLELLPLKEEGTFVIRWKNRSGPEIKIWDHRNGPGEYSYRIEFRNPDTGTHAFVRPAPRNRNYSPASNIVLAPRDGDEFEVDLHDSEDWIWPKGLPQPPHGWEARAWYRPPRDWVVEWAIQSHVTLDLFVGDWIKIS